MLRGQGWAPTQALFVCSLAAIALTGCAAPGSEIHLAPFYSRIHTADGAVEREALGGLWRERRGARHGELEQLTVGPFFGYTPEENGDYTAHFLVPFGYSRRRGEEGRSWLFPVYIYNRRQEGDGTTTRQLVSLPGIIWQKNDQRGTKWGWFPIYGDMEDFIVFERLTFVLFPIYIRCVIGGTTATSVLWPIFAWSTGDTEGFRVFPLYSRKVKEGFFYRTFVLWPIFHYQKNFQGTANPETVWMVWPIMGKKTRGTYVAYSWLWPFFGYAKDPRSGFWALDFPWPFVRLQRGPGIVHRTRFWPFYGYFREVGIEAWSYLWPIIHVRKEDTPDMTRESFLVIPLWQSWDRRDKGTGEISRWRKLFPLYQHERRGDWRRSSFPTLDPFGRNEVIDRFYSWMWKLYEWETRGEMRRGRAWLGLYRRERGLEEDRRSISGLWAHRSYWAGGERVKETSLLFGLLRWRVTEEEGFDMLPCAFPGPGWPAPASASDG